MAIRLNSEQTNLYTSVSNLFIDQYMPSANGEFVKVYLYLLRSIYAGEGEISVCTLADHLNHTEKDVCRALRYWEKCGLLKLTISSEHKLEEITLIDIPAGKPEPEYADIRVDERGDRSYAFVENADTFSEDADTFSKNADTFSENADTFSEKADTFSKNADTFSKNADTFSKNADTFSKNADTFSENADTFKEGAPAVQPGPAVLTRPAASDVPHKITKGRMNELIEQEDIHDLLIIVEEYMGKTLSSNFISMILYFYDELGFSAELIEFLVEYCVSRGKKSMRYIETVALTWHEEGITTVVQARESSSMYTQSVYTILKSFGIQGRSPVSSEMSYINKWTSDYGFTLEIITKACERTIMQIHQPSFEYADKILSNWHLKGVHEESDIARLDSARSKASARTAEKGRNSAANVDTRNRFNNFEQRDYDFQKLEKALLGM